MAGDSDVTATSPPTQDKRTGIERVRIVLAVFWALAALLACSVRAPVSWDVGVVLISLLVVGTGLATLAILHGPWSSSFLAALVLAIFHFAAFPSVLQGDNVGAAAGVTFFAPHTGPQALLLSVSGLSAFVSGSLVFGRRYLRLKDTNSTPHHGSRLGHVSAWATVFFIFLWVFLALVRTGINPLAVSYLDFLDQAEGSAWIMQPLGLFFAWSAMARGKTYNLALLVFCCWGAVAFFIGLRGEVLFPLVAHAAVLAASRRMPKFRWIIPLTALTLLASSLGRQVRDFGIRAYEFRLEDLALSNAMAELGFSQYVVETTVRWHEIQGEPFYRGATYFAPVERMLNRLLGLPVLDGESDLRLMNVEIIAREGQIGGSVIAEALHNFGPAGVPVILGIWGVAISYFRSRVSSEGQRMLAFEGLILFLFLWHVRNSFVPIPMQFFYGLFLILLLTRSSSSRDSASLGRDAVGA